MSLLVIGCVEGQFVQPSHTQGSPDLNQPRVMNRNANCYESTKMKVFQIIDRGILAHICPTDYPSFYRNEFEACIAEGELVFLPIKLNENDYVDDQKVALVSNQCFVPDGTFSYTTGQERQKRIRKIKIINL